MSQEHIRLIMEGADDYLTKPVDPEELLARIKVGQRISYHLRRTELETRKMFQEMDILLIQDGGCAPGYNPVTAFITYHLEAQGREVYATCEGFKSLIPGRIDDFVRLVYNPVQFLKGDIAGIYAAVDESFYVQPPPARPACHLVKIARSQTAVKFPIEFSQFVKYHRAGRHIYSQSKGFRGKYYLYKPAGKKSLHRLF